MTKIGGDKGREEYDTSCHDVLDNSNKPGGGNVLPQAAVSCHTVMEVGGPTYYAAPNVHAASFNNKATLLAQYHSILFHLAVAVAV